RIGEQYLELMNEVSNIPFGENALQKILDPEVMPKFSLAHVLRLTDDTGIVQHAKYGIPNLKEGYCLDDNSRALIMALMAYEQNKSPEALNLLPVYLSYIHYMQQDDGSFRNFLSFDRKYLDNVGSEDSFGRTVWALGYLINCAPNNSYRELARELFLQSVQHFERLEHIRGFANTAIGVAYFLKANPSDEGMVKHLTALVQPLIDAYQNTASEDWQWFEETMTYDNAILPLALLHASEITGDEKMRDIALKTLAFLDQVSFDKGYLNPIGNDGWYTRGGEFPMFDQQAIETMGMVMVYFQGYRITKDASFIQKLFMSYLWFLGENALRAPLYDHETKGCCDGLDATGINRNQGAESTLAYMISHLSVLKAFELEHEYTRSRQSRMISA
ncbi:MAG: glycosyl transferase, partial [Mucilaginibacter polytrichastri]|nr:glycosyl transferase [Mucilaginibacter polytrichastri]